MDPYLLEGMQQRWSSPNAETRLVWHTMCTLAGYAHYTINQLIRRLSMPGFPESPPPDLHMDNAVDEHC